MKLSRRNLLTTMIAASPGLLASVPRSSQAKSRDPLVCTPLTPAKPSDTGPGRKFGADGSMQRYPGNTVICHIPRPSTVFDELVAAYAELRAATGDKHITWLPASSYHMTVFDGVTDAYRRPGDWPHGLPLDATMEQCNAFVAERLRNFDLKSSLPLRMVIDDSPAAITRTSVRLRGIDDNESQRLYALRDRISQAIGVRHANHDTYEFHTTFGYYIRPFSKLEEFGYQTNFQHLLARLRRAMPVIELQAPEYCIFNDMGAFDTQFLLKTSTNQPR